MIRRVLVVLTAAVSAALFLGAAASASAGTLDQQQTANDNAAAAPYQSTSDAQSFTAGLTGGLDQVDLMLARSGTPTAYLTVEIRDVSGGVPGQAILAARSIPPNAVTNTTPQFIPVQFNPPAPVVAGTQYAIVAYSANPVSNWYTLVHQANRRLSGRGGLHQRDAPIVVLEPGPHFGPRLQDLCRAHPTPGEHRPARRSPQEVQEEALGEGPEEVPQEGEPAARLSLP